MDQKITIFLDRDGTLIVDKGYIADPNGVELIAGAKDVVARLHQRCVLFLLTNQSGVGRGWLTMADVVACNNRMLDLLGDEKLFLEICVAPETPDQPVVYRKPSPRFILEAMARYGLTPKNCYMVGDQVCDVEAGINAGINAVLVSQDEAVRSEVIQKFPAAIVLDSLESFADFLTKLEI